ncbi:MAG: hypothetical protein IT423_10855 [Pirellulaceae bacterium]|nr:hypothetical protein [Pirellulaceae bacterium]
MPAQPSQKRLRTTFKTRVEQFWSWFPEVAKRFEAALAADDPQPVVSEVSNYMATNMPGLSWALGRGEGDLHAFTLTGEGMIPKQLLAEYWHSRAIEMPGWVFHASRQPSSYETLKDVAIGVTDQEQVDAANFLIKTSIDEENEVIDLVAWHPSLVNVPEEHHFQILFLLLDEALGEFGVQTWLGELTVEPITDMTNTRNLLELPKFIQQVSNYHEWEKFPPLETYSTYEVPEQVSGPRGDTVVGNSCVPDLVFEYIENEGELSDDPLEDTGAEFVYISLDGAVFVEGDEVDARSNIEDELDTALAENLSGRTIGGATGVQHSYIDLLLFDGARSREIIEQILQRLQWAGKYEVVDF